jgi:hypothetical protein
MNKQQLKETCTSIIRERIKTLELAMAESQVAANNETKSSSGDKYETTRAMNQLEKDMLARQLSENNKELSSMIEIDCQHSSLTVIPGSLIDCGDTLFFILGGLGKMQPEGKTLFVISPNAPLAKNLFSKTKGDRFLFNRQELEILDVM